MQSLATTHTRQFAADGSIVYALAQYIFNCSFILPKAAWCTRENQVCMPYTPKFFLARARSRRVLPSLQTDHNSCATRNMHESAKNFAVSLKCNEN